jgi:hypothetical protein
LAFEQIFDVRDLFAGADRFHKVHTNGTGFGEPIA